MLKTIEEQLKQQQQQSLAQVFQGVVLYEEVGRAFSHQIDAFFQEEGSSPSYIHLSVTYSTLANRHFDRINAFCCEPVSLNDLYRKIIEGKLHNYEQTMKDDNRYQWIMSVYTAWKQAQDIVREHWWPTTREEEKRRSYQDEKPLFS